MVQEMICRLLTAMPPLFERTSAELLPLETFKIQNAIIFFRENAFSKMSSPQNVDHYFQASMR